MTTYFTEQPVHPFDAEIAALTLQIEEIRLFVDAGKGKYAADRPPDYNIAFASFEEELRIYETLLLDERLARSVDAAVHLDGDTIEESMLEEARCREDRLMALRTGDEEPAGLQGPVADLSRTDSDDAQDWRQNSSEGLNASSVLGFDVDRSNADETEAGPAKTFAERQADTLEKLSKRSRCVVCYEEVFSNRLLQLPCGDQYCIDCLKGHFIRATKDEALFPVRCHRKLVPLQLISNHLSEDELAAFNRASVEFSTVDRTYCSKRDCGCFIPPEQIQSATNEASCRSCGSSTCRKCKNPYHNSADCPDDPALRATRELAGEMGWQTCNRCGRLVMLVSGCNHMRCRCEAEFCYECGAEWKTCRCEHANAERILERAEEIVERDARFELPQRERQRRVHQVRAELEQNHECEHPGKFQRLFVGGRRGFRCEMCETRHWKYILQCRHCFINVCEDCRRHRV